MVMFFSCSNYHWNVVEVMYIHVLIPLWARKTCLPSSVIPVPRVVRSSIALSCLLFFACNDCLHIPNLNHLCTFTVLLSAVDNYVAQCLFLHMPCMLPSSMAAKPVKEAQKKKYNINMVETIHLQTVSKGFAKVTHSP